jgi:hypothetical protein
MSSSPMASRESGQGLPPEAARQPVAKLVCTETT